MTTLQAIEAAKARFGDVLEQQLERVERLRHEGDWTDYSAVKPLVIGMIGGDGIGPTISAATPWVAQATPSFTHPISIVWAPKVYD